MNKSFSLNSLKNLSLATIAIMVLPLVSCGGNGSSNKDTEETAHIYDTIWEDGHYKVVEVIEEFYDDNHSDEWAEAGEEAEESEKGINFDKIKGEDTKGAVKTYVPNSADFLSKDYQTYNLRGKVKSVTDVVRRSEYGDPDYYVGNEFNKKGQETFGRYGEGTEVEVKRNSNGFLEVITAYDCLPLRTEFFYTKDNWVYAITHSEDSSTTEEFTLFNEYGDPLTSLLYGECYPDPELCGSPWGKYEYKYLKRDDKGNWTKRAVRFTELYDKTTSVYTKERVIEYY